LPSAARVVAEAAAELRTQAVKEAEGLVPPVGAVALE